MSLGKFDETLLEQIRQRAPLVEEVRKVVSGTMKKKGRHYWACCPFHHEKTASFSVREQGDFYHCFGCGAHGDVFTLVMETQSKSFPEAVQQLADQTGVKLPTIQRDPEQEKTRNDGYKALARAQVFYQRNLGPAERYLEKRGLSEETISTFGLGYAPDSFSDTREALLSEGFSPEVLRATGLGIESTKGKGDYDRFRGRLMFPIHDLKDRVVGFGGRVMGSGEPKYLNSPETAFFDKSGLLYNLNRARGHIKTANRLLLVEGYMDAISLWQAGFKTAVAPMGTAITPTQIQTLWRFHSRPLVCLDGDSAGQKAAVRMARRTLEVIKPGVDVGFIWLPEGEDPDSLIQSKGKTAFEALLKQSVSLEQILWDDVATGQNLTTGTGRAAVEQEITMLMAEVKDATMQRHLSRALKDRLWQAGRANGKTSKNQAGQAFLQGKANHVPKTVDVSVQNILALCCAQPWLVAQFEEELSELQVADKRLENVRQILLQAFLQKALAAAEFSAHVQACGLTQEIENLCASPAIKAVSGESEGVMRSTCKQWLTQVKQQEATNGQWQKLSLQENWQKLMQVRQARAQKRNEFK